MALDTPGPLGSGGFGVLRVSCWLVCFDSKRTPIKWSLTFYLQHGSRCSDKEVPSQPPSFIPKMLQGNLRNNWNPKFLWGRNNVLTIAALGGQHLPAVPVSLLSLCLKFIYEKVQVQNGLGRWRKWKSHLTPMKKKKTPKFYIFNTFNKLTKVGPYLPSSFSPLPPFLLSLLSYPSKNSD